jgi:predicted DNA-binding antitoxin AbrB/MazE fold protein
MALYVRAIYENGMLRLLEPIDLAEGQEVQVNVNATNEKDELRAILSDLPIRWSNPDDDTDAWVEDMADEIDRAFQGEPPLSQYIIEDRGDV